MITIEISNLSFNYVKNIPVLSNINLSIEGGTITAILGKNGCGKSTLLDCMIGYNNYKEGTILINKKGNKIFSEKQLAVEVAYIPQTTISNMDFTVEEFILFGRNCHLKFGESLSKDDFKLMYEKAELVGITNILDKSINKISGGERQLAFIARALVQESPIIIMDEPTANLDFGNQAILFSIIKRLKDEGKTIIYTTHNPNQVRELDCDVIGMRDGLIICHGKAKDVLNIDQIKKLYGDDFDVKLNGNNFTIHKY